MKKARVVLSLILCLAMVLSVVPVISAETAVSSFDAEAKMTGLTDGSVMKINARIVNTGDTDGKVKAYKAVYNKSEQLKKASTEIIELAAGESKSCAFEVSYNRSAGECAKVYLWKDKTNEPLCEPFSSALCDEGSFDGGKIEINKDTVFASRETESGHNASLVGDGSLKTYWSAKGVTDIDPQYAAAVFDDLYYLTRVGISFGLGAERSYEFSVEASADGKYYETVVDRQMSEKTENVQYYDTAIAKAKYVKFVIYGKDTADSENWIRVNEIEAYGSKVPNDDESENLLNGDWSSRAMTEYNQDYTPALGTRLYGENDGETLHLFDGVGRDGKITDMVKVKSVTASQTPESNNSADKVTDFNTGTKWTAKDVSEKTPAELLIELENESYVDTLKMAFGEGKDREYVFKAEISADGVTYTTAVEKTKSQKNNNIQKFAFTRTKAKFIKLTFYGRTDVESGWIQITEAEPCDSHIEAEGAGGVLMGRQFETTSDRGKYNISFDMNFPSVNSQGQKTDFYWNGITLSNSFPSGGADGGALAAMQLRFEGSNGKVKIRKLTSNRFNEGDLKNFFQTEFDMDKDIHFSFDVDPKSRRIDISISDGELLAQRYLYFNYENDERTRPSTWTGHEAKWLIFNSGVSSKSEYFVKNVVITRKNEEKSEPTEVSLGKSKISEDSVEFRALSDSVENFEASLGEKLYGEVVDAPKESGISGKAVHLYDGVGRVTDSVSGAGGVSAYIDLPSPNTKTVYKVDFTMYAPDPGDYGGFSLGSGRNYSVGTDQNPLCAQLRFFESVTDEKAGVKFAAYDSEKLNSGNLGDLVGKYTPIEKNVPWHISIIVDPRSYYINLSVDDGVNYQGDKTKSFCGSSKTWLTGRKIDTLMINTGIGGSGEIYVGDVKVTDLGDTGVEASTALNGVLRLMAQNGTGKYMHHNGDVTVDFAEKQTLNYTRFVERGGLMGSDGVSFEAMNKPGYFLTIMPGDDNLIQLKPYENSARFKANSTFIKENTGWGSNMYMYSTYRDPSKYLYDDSGSAKAWSMHDYNRICFKLKSETSTVVGDDFKSGLRWDEWIPGYSYNQKWDGGTLLSYHNHSGVARSSNVVVENGVCTLKATKAAAHIGDKWGIDYNQYNFHDENGKKKGWTSFAGYVGVITARASANSDMTAPYKFNRNSLIEGSFKQPVGARGYWTAFWLAGDVWPPEIDIFEYMSRYGGGKWFSNIHRSTSSSSGTYHEISDGSLQTKFHSYTLDWGDGFIDYYFDGTWFKRVTGDMANFQYDCKLIINTGLGGWEYEPNNQTVWDTGLQIDWVRAYQW